jgi:hypothetical protein
MAPEVARPTEAARVPWNPIKLAIPSYAGAAYVATVFGSHFLPKTATGSNLPDWITFLPGVVMIAIMYVGMFCWGLGPLLSGAAGLVIVVQCLRARSLVGAGCLAPVVVGGSLVAWCASVPLFAQALKW